MASVDDDEPTADGVDGVDEVEALEDELIEDLVGTADDEPEDELEDGEADDDQSEASSEPPRQGMALGPMLLMFACGGWLVWAVLHFGVDDAAGPAMAVVEDPTQEPTPEPAADAVPEPVNEEPTPAEEPPPEEPPPEEVAPGETPWVEENWTEGIEPPTEVKYTVKRGGQLKNVANLFKIYHHEIVELNPKYKLEQELPPGTEIVVWRAKEGHQSQSIGTPGRGSLEGAVPMVDGPGRSLKMIPWKSWATVETVATLDRVLAEWRRRYPDADPVLVGNMSAPSGGKLQPHSSHQSGRDVDLSYPQIRDEKEELNWREMSAVNLDREMTWNLMKLLVESGAVEHIFIDTKLQKLLHEWAVEHEPVPKRKLGRWLEYPRRPGSTGAIVQHVPGHTDHLHVRFACPPKHDRCKSK